MGTRKPSLKDRQGFWSRPSRVRRVASSMSMFGYAFMGRSCCGVNWAKRGLALPVGKGWAGSKDRGTGATRGSAHAVLQRLFHGGSGVQGAKDMKGGDGLPGQFRRDIRGNAGETEDLNVQHFAGRLHGLEVLAAVVAQAEVELVSSTDFLTASLCRSS